MTPSILILLLRAVIIILLFLFLLQVFLLARRDLKVARMQRTQRGGHLRVLESAATNLAKGALLPLLGVNSLGRSPDRSLPVFDESVSGEHLLLTYEDGAWRAEDLGSTNGTFINGQKLERPSVLTYGDVIQMGRTRLRLERPRLD